MPAEELFLTLEPQKKIKNIEVTSILPILKF
uniref:Uncharacterized protein n=1 Tax=Arundo donax TaxID=35708 RepID=A0A0A9CQT6_ARUDO